MTELKASDHYDLHISVLTPKSGFQIVPIDNLARNTVCIHQFFTQFFPRFYNGKTKAPIRSLTSPHIVIIICSYLFEFSLNLSEATLNIFNTRIKCSTEIR